MSSLGWKLLSLALVGCSAPGAAPRTDVLERDAGARPDAATATGQHDASTRGPARQDRTLRLTLNPFWEGGPVPAQLAPVEGVAVCLARARGHGDGWRDFVETDGPCAPATVADEKVVLEGIPALADLLVTASRNGYRPVALGLSTFAVDVDLAAVNAASDSRSMHLERADSMARIFPDADPALGSMTVVIVGLTLPVPAIAGARFELEPALGSGPYYVLGDTLDSSATGSLPGLIAGPFMEPASTPVPFATFADLPAGDYVLRVSPPAGAHMNCNAYGDRAGYPADHVNEARFSVLPGHTTLLTFACSCTGDFAWETMPPCAAAAPDAGAP